MQLIYKEKRGTPLTREALHAVEEGHAAARTATNGAIGAGSTLIAVNLLFVVSYVLDVQLVEGALTASRVIGFHMADLNSALQVTLAYKHIVLNL
jgi:ferredoxin-type protein NapH